MKLNLLKCAFIVASRKFLGFMFNQRGIKANPKKIQALVDIRSLSKTKEVQSLTGRVAALNRFISKATNKCLLFFDSLKGNKKFLGTTSVNKRSEHSKNTWASYRCFQSLLTTNHFSSTYRSWGH